MLLPNRVKFRKMHRLPLRGKATVVRTSHLVISLCRRRRLVADESADRSCTYRHDPSH